MRKLILVPLLLVAAISTGGASGCQTLKNIVDPSASVGGGHKIDEQAMGAVDTLGTSANYIITAAARSDALSRDQLLKAQQLRRDIDAAHAAAYAAYKAGDAKAFNDKMAAVTDLAKKAQSLFNEVKTKP
jgi:hypothetical protein